MKKFLTIVFLTCACLLIALEHAHAQAEWSVQNSGITTTLYGVKAVSSTVVWACGADGRILRSTDGGSTWASRARFTYGGWRVTAYSVDALTADRAFATLVADSAGRTASWIVATTDGGANWSQPLQSGAAGTFYNAVRFWDTNTGIMMGDPENGYFAIYTTTNGGTTWNRVPQASIPALAATDEIGYVNNLAVVGNSAWFGTNKDRVFRTTNRGSTWSVTTTGLAEELYSTSFVTEQTGLVIGLTTGRVVRTTNGGASWGVPISTGLSRGYGLTYVTSSAVVAVGQAGGVVRSTDGGTTWNKSTTPITASIYGVSFAQPAFGWAVGEGGVILRWIGGNLGITANPPSLSFGNVNVGSTGSQPFVVTNGTTAFVTFTSLSFTNAAFTTTTSSFLLSPNGTQTINVTYRPLTARSDTGTVYIYHDQAGSPLRVTLSGSAGGGTLTEIEPNNTAGQAMLISLGDSVNASIGSSGDIDYYRFAATAGDTVEVYSYNTGTSNLDGAIWVYDNAGTEVASNDDFLTTSASRAVFVVRTSGTHYIRYAFFATTGGYPNSIREHDPQHPLALAASARMQAKSAFEDPTGTYRIRLRRFQLAAPIISHGYPFNTYSTSTGFYVELYPNGLATSVTVQYGLTTSYGQTATLTIPASLGEGSGSITMTGLTAATTYQCRIVATNIRGTTTGSNFTFSTPPAASGWAFQTSPTTQPLYGVSFVDANVGTAVGELGVILRTTNGGSTWTSQTSNTTRALIGVYLANTTTGFAVGEAGTILRTTNGGTTWSLVTSGTSSSLYDISFGDVNNGLAVGLGGVIIRTSNGGSSWISQNSGTSANLLGVRMFDANTATAVGANGTLLRTTNGGSTWTTQSSGTSEILYDLSFVNSSIGTVVGSSGIILRTTNGGASWVSQSSGTSNWLFGVVFADANTGYTVGENGHILRTTNAGSSWSQVSSGTFNNIFAIGYAGNAYTGVGTYGMILRSSTTVTPTISVSTTSISFGSVTVGTSSQQTFSISNTGGASLAVSGISSSNTVFSVNPSSSFNVAAGGSQTVTVTYTPTSATIHSGTLSITHNAAGSPTAVSLTGTGTIVTLPTVTTSAATSVTATSATLSGTVNPNGTVTTAFFEWGTSNTLSTSTATASQSVGSGTTAQTVTANLTGLTAGTTYYFRIAAQNSGGTQRGTIQSFTTTTGAAVISLPATLNAGSAVIGNPVTSTLVVSNTGAATLTVNSIATAAPFSVTPTSLTVTAGGSQSVTVTYTASAVGVQTGSITLTHNAAGSPSSVAVSGTGTATVTSLSTTTGRFSSGIPASRWVLMSIPYNLDNPSPSAQFGSTLTGSNAWKMYAYSGGSNQDISNSPFQLGRGFWFKTVARSSSFSVSFGSGSVHQQQQYAISLPAGWTLIGTPFYNNEADWSPINTTAGTSGIRIWKYVHESETWTIMNPVTELLKPFGGYAVYNQTGGTATLTLARNKVSTKVTPEWEPGDGWYIVLRVGNASLRMGEHRRASAGADYYDYPAPPAPPDTDHEYPTLAGKLWSDIRPVAHENVSQWKIVVDPSIVSSVGVEEFVQVPLGWKIMLQGIPNAGTMTLQEGTSFTLPADVRTPFVMTVVAGPDRAVEERIIPVAFALEQNYPNPFNPSTRIGYRLSLPCSVELKIVDVRGHIVRTLVQGFQQPGLYEVQWDGRDDGREMVSSGVYFYTLQAGSFSQTRKLLFVR